MLNVTGRIGLTYVHGSPNYRPGTRRGDRRERVRYEVDANYGKPQST
jgi:hypothetical protein